MYTFVRKYTLRVSRLDFAPVGDVIAIQNDVFPGDGAEMAEVLEVGVLRGLVCLDNPMDFLGLAVDNTRYREIQKKKPRPSARFYTFRARSPLGRAHKLSGWYNPYCTTWKGGSSSLMLVTF